MQELVYLMLEDLAHWDKFVWIWNIKRAGGQRFTLSAGAAVLQHRGDACRLGWIEAEQTLLPP